MTSVNVTTTKNTVTVNGETRVVTVKTAGPQGTFTDGNLGDVTVSSNGTAIAINTGAVTSAKILDGTIVNDDISGSAAIAGSKVAPDFGSQNISTTGTLASASTTITGTSPTITFVDSNQDPDYRIRNNNGVLNFQDASAGGVTKLSVSSSGAAVTGDLSVSGTVDSVDLSTYQADGGSYLRSDADDSFTGTLTGVSDTVNPVIQINGAGPNFIRFDSGDNTPSDSIDLIYRTNPNTLAFERASDSVILFSVDADDRQAVFNGNVDCNSGLDVSGGDITGVLGSAVTGTTQSASDNSTKIATTAYTDTAIANLVNSAPSTLDTLGEIATELGNQESTATALANNIATKLPLAGGTLIGDLTISTTAPLIKFDESDQTTDYFIVANNNTLTLARNNLNTPNHIQKWNADGHVDFLTNVDFASGIDVTGQIVSESTTGTGSTGLKIANSNESFVQYFEGAGANATFVMSYTGSGGTDIRFAHNGEIQVNYAGQEKFKTTSTGISVTGEIHGTSHLDLPNDAILNLGDNDEFQIFHQSSNGNSIIKETGGGPLSLQTNGANITFRDNTNQVNMAQFITGGSCTFRHAADIRLRTTSTGVAVTGNLTLPDNGQLQLGDATGGDSQIYHTGSHAIIKNSTGNLILQDDDNIVLEKINGENMLVAAGDGAVSLYYDGGTYGTPKLSTTSTGIQVNGSIVTYGDVLASGTAPQISLTETDTTTNSRVLASVGQLFIQAGATGSGSSGAGIINLTGFNNVSASQVICKTDLLNVTGNLKVDNDTLFVDSTNDRVGINTASPISSSALDVNGGINVTGGIGLSGALLVGNEINMFNGTTNSHRFIDCGLGDNNDLRIRGCSGGDTAHENMIVATRGGSVNLYYDGVTTPKLETTATGVTVNGLMGIGTSTIARGPVHVHHASTGDCQIHLTNNTTGTTSSDGFTIFAGQPNGDCGLVSRESGGSIEFYTHNGTSVGQRLRINSDGKLDVTGDLAVDTDTLFVDSTNDRVGINNASPTEALDVTGNIQMAGTGFINIPDSTSASVNRLRLGSSSDYQIYHNGTNAVMDNFTGALFIKSLSSIHLQNRTNNELMASFVPDGAVSLYYDGGTYSTPKLETTAFGVTVDGTVQTGAVNLNGTFPALYLFDNDSNATDYRIVNADGTFKIQNQIASNNIVDRFLINSNGDVDITGELEAKSFRFGDSHVKRISVDYTGEETGGDGSAYLNDNEFQEILTITPSSSSQNYSVIGRIMAASGANVHTIDINVALRSNTLPDLTVSGSYISTITGTTEYLTPRFWLKETTTAAFKLVVEINQQIFGRVTADLEIISRSEADLNNIVVNEDETSEVTSITTGYAQTTPTKVYETDDGAFSFNGGLTAGGNIVTTGTITCTSLTQTSDIALKENIQPLSNVLDKVKQLTGYKYNFKNNEEASMGVIAQDVEKVFPELVHGEEGKKSLQYSGLVGALIEAVKELSAKVAALESK